MGGFIILAAVGVAIAVLVGWVLLAGSAEEIFREW